jgi:hypothetical protein
MAHHGSGRSVSRQEALSAVQASDVGTLRAALNACSAASYDDEVRRRTRCHAAPAPLTLLATRRMASRYCTRLRGTAACRVLACSLRRTRPSTLQTRRDRTAPGCAAHRQLYLHSAARAQDGFTPLHIACHWGFMEIVSFLCETGAAVNAADQVRACALPCRAARARLLTAHLLNGRTATRRCTRRLARASARW